LGEFLDRVTPLLGLGLGIASFAIIFKNYQETKELNDRVP
jgi:hypothetical protein